jgi:hypothetical protein
MGIYFNGELLPLSKKEVRVLEEEVRSVFEDLPFGSSGHSFLVCQS